MIGLGPLNSAGVRSLLLILVMLAAWAADAEVPPQRGVQHQRFETSAGNAALGLDGSADPYDPEQVRVDAVVTFPDGSSRAQPCFWYVPQERVVRRHFQSELQREVDWERFTPSGPGEWRLRLLPRVTGLHHWDFRVATPAGTVLKPGGDLLVAAQAGGPPPGPVRLGPNRHGFSYADGRPFIPIGLNLAWPDELGSQTTAGWLGKLRDAGGNCARIWMIQYYGGTSLEWSPNGVNDGYLGVGRYSQESAARLDRIFAAAQADGLQLMLCFFSFGNHNWDWKNNPYGDQAGGWLRGPAEFFTDAKARRVTANMLRYAVARWGAEPSLWAWELWNEVDASNEFDGPAVADWHRVMAATIRREDLHGHLITTDYRFPPPNQPCLAYALDDIDFAQAHEYLPDLPRTFLAYTQLLEPFRKPVLISEYGLHVSPNYFAIDPSGMHVHDGLWAGAFSGSAGAALGWWWDRYVAPRDLWYHHTGIARFFAGRDLDATSRLAATINDDQLLAMALDGGRPIAWVSSRRRIRIVGESTQWAVSAYGSSPLAAPARLTLWRKPAGAWRAVFWDTFDGVVVGSAPCQIAADRIAVDLPAFRHDLAVSFEPASDLPPAVQPVATPLHDRFAAESARQR